MSVEIGQLSTDGEVVFDLHGDGLYLYGDRDRVEALLEGLLSPAEAAVRRDRNVGIADMAAGPASVSAVLKAREEYLRLSPETLAKIKNGAELSDDGVTLRGYLRKAGKMAGDVKTERVDFAPEQALALQSAAVSLALRSAIADVARAVEEVQHSVDELARRARAQEVGRVVGLYEHLASVADSTHSRGRLLKADWDSVSGAGLQLRQSLTALRAYAHSTLSSMDDDARLPKRVRALAAFSDREGLGGTLNLIAVAEKAIHMWEYLRIEHTRTHDSAHVESALEDARTLLQTNQRQDRQLVEAAIQKLEALRQISPFEIHHLLAIPDLQTESRDALSTINEFATVSRNPMPTLDPHVHRPQLAETRAEVKRHAIDAKDGAAGVSKAIGRATSSGAKKATSKVTEPFRSLGK